MTGNSTAASGTTGSDSGVVRLAHRSRPFISIGGSAVNAFCSGRPSVEMMRSLPILVCWILVVQLDDGVREHLWPRRTT